MPKLSNCTRCRVLQKQFRTLRNDFPDYWNKPVPASGDPEAPLMIVGLAPGKHGANRTGIPFTGDASGELLFLTLRKLDLVNQVSITNAVKCLPVQNKPSTTEINNCQRHLKPEVASHGKKSCAVFLALGQVAHNALLKASVHTLSHFPFSHGAEHQLSPHVTLVDSYHCSRYNTQTKRLTPNMFERVVARAAQLAGASIPKRILSD